MTPDTRRAVAEQAAHVTVFQRTANWVMPRLDYAYGDRAKWLFAHVPGLRVVCPTTPTDARDMLLGAIEHPDPVIFMEPKKIYRAGREDVPEIAPFTLGSGDGQVTELLTTARTAREGSDLAIITYGSTVPLSVEAAERLAAEREVEAMVLDLRALYPLDVDAVVNAARRCGRALVVHEAPRTSGLGAEISSLIHERAMLDLEAPVLRVTGFDVPFPHAGRYAFEITVDHLLTAGMTGEVDPLNGVAENIIVGQPVNLGTGAVRLAMDTGKLQKLIKTMPKPVSTVPVLVEAPTLSLEGGEAQEFAEATEEPAESGEPTEAAESTTDEEA